MHDAVRELAELTGWTGQSYVDTPWDVVHAKLGFELPLDYRELPAVFPPGKFSAPDRIADVIVWPLYRVDGVEDQGAQDHRERSGAGADHRSGGPVRPGLWPRRLSGYLLRLFRRG